MRLNELEPGLVARAAARLDIERLIIGRIPRLAAAVEEQLERP